MKVKRYKRAHKVLEYYTTHFGLRRPYQVLLDATFCAHALKFQIALREHVPKYLQDDSAVIVTTACVLQEVQALGAPLSGVLTILKQFQLRKCLHSKSPVGASQCLYDCVQDGNPNHFIVATQDAELSQRVRRVAGVPLLYFHLHSITLEKPSALSQSAHEAETQQKFALTPHEHEVLKKLNKDILGKTDDDDVARKKIKKRSRGPNPLSVKKKMKRPTDAAGKEIVKRPKEKANSSASSGTAGLGTSAPRSRFRKRRHRAQNASQTAAKDDKSQDAD